MQNIDDDSTANLHHGDDMFLRTGTLINGRYKVLSILGNGGMGTVYLAQDQNVPTGRLCAVKETHAVGDDAQQRALGALRLEWEYMNTLQHPAIPIGYDYFGWQGRQYLVMEYIEGDSLAKKLEDRKQQIEKFDEITVATWAIQICDIFHYLHTQQRPIYYRDCKPENFILSPSGKMRIIDFGIARRERDAPNKVYTALGTKGYAAPEAYTGECDARTDIFSLGVMMHALLTYTDPDKIWSNMWRENPPRNYRPNLSRAFDQVIMRCLEPDRTRRWASVADLRAALEQIAKPHPSALLVPRATNVSHPLVGQSSQSSAEVLDSPESRGPQPLTYGGARSNEFMRPHHSVSPSPLWHWQAEAPIHTAATQFGDVIYLGSLDHKLYALNREGKLIGTYRARAPIYSDPLVTRRGVYCCAEDGTIVVLDHSLKRVIWTQKTRERIISSPVIIDDLLVVGTDAHHVLAFNARNGEPRWECMTQGAVRSEMAVINDLVIFGADDANIYAIDAQGQRRWSHRCRDKIEARPELVPQRHGELVMVGSFDRKLYALAVESGFVDWMMQTEGSIVGGAAFDGRYLYVGSGDGCVYCLDTQRRGEERWKYNTRSQISSDLVWRAGRLYFGDADGNVTCLRTEPRDVMWCFKTEGAVVARPLVLDNQVIITSKDHSIYALPDPGHEASNTMTSST